MNDQELADRIYALVGLCGFDALEAGKNYEYVRDARVAMAMLNKCLRIVIHRLSDSWTVTAINDADEGRTAHNESLPRAINEACCEALS